MRASRRGYVALPRTVRNTLRSSCKVPQYLPLQSRCFSTFQPKSQSISDTIKQILGLAQPSPSKETPRSKLRTTVQQPPRTPGRKPIRTKYPQFDEYLTGVLRAERDEPKKFFLAPRLNAWLGRRHEPEHDTGTLQHERWLDYSPCVISELKSYPRLTSNNSQVQPMKSHLEFVTVPTADTPGTTLLLHYNSQRYMIGRVGEGTQRAWVERGISMRKIEHVFLTGKTSSENVGGLLGMVLTMADILKEAKEAKKEQQDRTLHIYGASNLLHIIATARRFTFRRGMPLSVKELKDVPGLDCSGKWKPTYEDENIRLWPMVIKPETDTYVESPTFKSRKRTFDQINGIDPKTKDKPDSEGEAMAESEAVRDARYDTLRQAVVHDMFGSQWSLDCLVETPLDEVRLPAKIWIRDGSAKGIKEYSGPLPGGAEPLPDPKLKVLVRSPWPGALVSALPPTTPKEDAVSYIIHPQPRRGKFDVQRANELGVPKGQARGKLTNGESITLDDGRVITSEMVLGDEQLGNGVAVVDLPSDDYVTPLIEREEWTSKELTEHLSAVIWILGPGVSNNDRLRKFIDTYSNVKHIVASPDVCPNELAFESSATSAARLAQMDIDNFPIPHFDNATVPQASYHKYSHASKPTSILSAERGLRLQVEPQFMVQKDKIVTRLDTLGLVADSNQKHISLARSALSSIHKEASEIQRWKDNLPKPGPDVEIVTLGTGSALPSKYRNVSATLVRVPGYGNCMLDCGENTLGQLQRVFDPDELRDVLKKLRLIWISHLHADHHLGTVSLIKAWHSVVHGSNPTVPPITSDFARDLRNSTLTSHLSEKGTSSALPYLAVLSQQTMLHSLSEHSYAENFGYSHILPLAVTPADPFSTDPDKVATKLKLIHNKCPPTIIDPRLVPTYLGLRDVQSVFVEHCSGAQAVAMTFLPIDTEPFKLAYSGDCRPSKRFSVIGRNSTVLIHEATFDDELQQEAMAKKHSTTSEALRVGAEMRARSVILTHFSQRYQKIPVLDVKNFGTGLEGIEDDEVNKPNPEEDEIRDVPEPQAESELEIKAREQIVNLVNGLDHHQQQQQQWMQITADESAPLESATASEPEATSTDLMGPQVSASETEDSNMEGLTEWNPRIVEPGESEEKVAKARDMKVCVAFDYMRVKIGDIPKVAALRPAIMALFDEEQKALATALGDANNGKGDSEQKPMSKRQQKKLAQKRSRESLIHSDDAEVAGK